MRGVLLLRPMAMVACAAAVAALTAAAAGAQNAIANGPSPASAACEVTAERVSLLAPLVRTARKLAEKQPITIVALGSSSTYGFGASTPAASYPSRLAEDLRYRLPGRTITVLNRGHNNDEAPQMLARLDRDVIAEHPDVVLWQVGTNALLWKTPLQSETLRQGLARMKAVGADIVLIDPQFAPQVIAASAAEQMVSFIAATARAERVGLFRRYALMRHWHKVEHLPLQAFLSPDGLHLNDWSYACFGKWVGAAIAQATKRVQVSGGRTTQ